MFVACALSKSRVRGSQLCGVWICPARCPESLAGCGCAGCVYGEVRSGAVSAQTGEPQISVGSNSDQLSLAQLQEKYASVADWRGSDGSNNTSSGAAVYADASSVLPKTTMTDASSGGDGKGRLIVSGGDVPQDDEAEVVAERKQAQQDAPMAAAKALAMDMLNQRPDLDPDKVVQWALKNASSDSRAGVPLGGMQIDSSLTSPALIQMPISPDVQALGSGLEAGIKNIILGAFELGPARVFDVAQAGLKWVHSEVTGETVDLMPFSQMGTEVQNSGMGTTGALRTAAIDTALVSPPGLIWSAGQTGAKLGTGL
jgi:hypothetical protein